MHCGLAFASLKKLDISGCYSVDSVFVRMLLAGRPSIQLLDVSHCRGIGDVDELVQYVRSTYKTVTLKYVKYVKA